MTKRLKNIFNPQSIAFIGATDKQGSVGLGVCKNLLEGKDKRKIFFVNPFREEVLKRKTYPDISSINESIDLVIIAVPAKVVLKVTKEAVQKKVGGIIIISSGFAETGDEGKILQDKIVKIVKEAGIPLIGPNCLGMIRPSIRLNTSFAPGTPQKGNIAFISQSGALIDSVIDRSFLEKYGFSVIVSYGNEADLQLCDFLEWAGEDEETKVIGVYLEAIKDGSRFMKVAKKIARKKPILVLKAGKTKAGKKSVVSHTAVLAGSDDVYSAAFRQTGVIEVKTMEELLDNLKALSWQPRCDNGIAILTNGGGCGVLLADSCEEAGVKLTKLSSSTLNKLKKSKKMHPAFSKRNPLDILGDALSDRYEEAIKALLSQKNIRGLIVIQTLQIMTEVEKNAKAMIRAAKKWPHKPIIGLFMGGKYTSPGIKLLEKNMIPNYSDPRRAALSMRALIKKI